MICGVKLDIVIDLPFSEWLKIVDVSTFKTFVFIEDGNVKTKTRGNSKTTTYTATWRSYTLTFTEIETIKGIMANKKQNLQIEGSLHTNYFKGNNYQPFTWNCLQHEINNVCTGLKLKPSKVKISNIEVGVNVPLDFDVNTFVFKDIIHYMGKKFNQYDKDRQGVELGIVLKLTDYVVKIYDKGLQNNLQQELLRIEKRFNRMRKLNTGYKVFTLADLQDLNKVAKLVNEILEMWDNVLVFDIKKDYSNHLISKWTNPNYWKEISGKKRERELKKCKLFLKIQGGCKHDIIRALIVSEWQQLLNNVTLSPSVQKLKVVKSVTISPSVQELPAPRKKGTKNKECHVFTNTVNVENVTPRFCGTCGKDISHQHKKSKYCSAKYVGYKAAHKCRNDKSNPKNNFKNKVVRLETKGLLFDIMPFFVKESKRMR